LIRDFDDFGVMVLGDPRIKTKTYGRVFLESMPPSPVVSDVAVAAEFLRDQMRKRQVATVPAVQT
jgi:ATP-dependent DNA helicase DinG